MEKAVFDYYYHHLTLEQQNSYSLMFGKLQSGNLRITCRGIHYDQVAIIVKALLFDHPELFEVHPEIYEIQTVNRSIIVYFRSFLSDVQKRQVEKEYMSIAEQLRKGIGKNCNQSFRQLAAIHQYILSNVHYNDILPPEWTASAVGPVINRSGKCSGISRMVKVLCDIFLIPCIIVYGYCKGRYGVEEHSWNIVSINGKWTHFDMTSDMTIGNGRRVYDYFGLTDREIEKTHSWDREITPYCYDKDVNFYAMINRRFDTLYAAIEDIKQRLEKGDKRVIGKINSECDEREFYHALQTLFSHESEHSVSFTVNYNPVHHTYVLEKQNDRLK